jgi:hypothetical protein
MARSRQALTVEQRRAEQRELVRVSIEQLRSSDGWQAWVKARCRFLTYSWRNVLLILSRRTAAHCLLRRTRWTFGPVATGDRCVFGGLVAAGFAGSRGWRAVGPLVAGAFGAVWGPTAGILAACGPRSGGGRVIRGLEHSRRTLMSSSRRLPVAERKRRRRARPSANSEPIRCRPSAGFRRPWSPRRDCCLRSGGPALVSLIGGPSDKERGFAAPMLTIACARLGANELREEP